MSTTSAWIDDLLRTAVGGGVAWTRERIAVDRGLTGVIERVTWPAGRRTRGLILKIPRTGTEYERAAREVTFLSGPARALGAPAPRCLAAVTDRDAGRVALALEAAPGRDADITSGVRPDGAREILDALLPMWAQAWQDRGLERLPWLQRWGAGVRGSHAPFHRTVRRYRTRVPMFLDRFGAAAAPEVPDLLRAIGRDLEPRLHELGRFPHTLIHADLHLDNVRVDPVTVLDWQSVSYGPITYDLARFLGAALMGQDQECVDGLLDHVGRALIGRGVPSEDVEALPAHFDAMLERTLVGLVSGYGGVEPGDVPERVVESIHRSVSRDGLVGMVLARRPPM